MRRIKKSTFFIVVAFIAIMGYLTFFGLSSQYGDVKTTYVKGAEDIRWGIDIQGGVSATFEPEEGYDASAEDMEIAKGVIEQRLIALGVTDSEVFADTAKNRVLVSFPWQAGETDFNPEAAIAELGETAVLQFVKGSERSGEIVLTGADVEKAQAVIMQTSQSNGEWQVMLKINKTAQEAFEAATRELAGTGIPISIWMDETCVSAPTVNDIIDSDTAYISGSFDADSAQALASKINSGSIPFKLVATSTSTISPTLGEGAKNAMVFAGIIAFIVVAIFMIAMYKLQGVVAVIGLTGQVILTIAAISGFFASFPSFSLTIPGIAGIILSIGMGVDANVITAERIKEELRSGKSLAGAIETGYKKAWNAVFDGNITVIFVAIILMGAFGPTDSLFATLLTPIFFAFGAATAGTIYSLGYTLLVGIACNFLFGIFFSRLMVSSLSKFKCFKNRTLYGDLKEGKTAKAKNPINVCKHSFKFYTVSTLIAVVAIVMTFVGGLNIAIEFKGGTLISYSYEGEVNTNEIEAIVEEAAGQDCIVKLGENMADSSKTINLSFSTKEGIGNAEQIKIKEALQTKYADNNIESYSTSDVSPTNGKEFFFKCLVAVAAAAVIMVIYIGFRFKKIGGISAGCMAVVALVHDMVMVYACFVFAGFSIDANFMAVLLTILGYSINATIIIYDRVRENTRIMGANTPVEDLVSNSVAQTLSRSINTTITTLSAMIIVAVVCAFYGITSIQSFTIPLIVGMVSGVYSSNCIAPTLWVLWQNRKKKKA